METGRRKIICLWCRAPILNKYHNPSDCKLAIELEEQNVQGK